MTAGCAGKLEAGEAASLSRNAAIEADNRALLKENSDLIRKLARTKAENKALRSYNSELASDNRSLRARVEELESGKAVADTARRYEELLSQKERKIEEVKKELADSHAETREAIRSWQKTCEELVEENDKRTAEMQAETNDYKTRLAAMAEKAEELTARLNKDYTNSSKPSSTDPNHKKIPNNREKTGKRPGAQPGHEQHPRKTLEPTRTVEIPVPEKYKDTGRYKPTGKMIRKQVISVKTATDVTEYVTPEYRDVITGQRVHARFPGNIKDEVSYDGTVKAFAYLLNNSCNVSIGKTKTFIEEITGGRLRLSTGMICKLAREFAGKTEEERNEIYLALMSSDIMHADFTFCRKDGKQANIIVCALDDGTVLYQNKDKKGNEGVKGSPLEHYTGTVISDHEAALLRHGARHQECLVHVERYLRASVENEGLTWSGMMLKWVQESIHYRNECLRDGAGYDGSKVAELLEEYDNAIETGRREYEESPPKQWYRDGYNLYKRMATDKDDYQLFLRDINVAPDNNICENKARKVKRKAAQVMCFRSDAGVTYYCDGLTMIESIRGAGGDLYAEIVARFGVIEET